MARFDLWSDAESIYNKTIGTNNIPVVNIIYSLEMAQNNQEYIMNYLFT